MKNSGSPDLTCRNAEKSTARGGAGLTSMSRNVARVRGEGGVVQSAESSTSRRQAAGTKNTLTVVARVNQVHLDDKELQVSK